METNTFMIPPFGGKSILRSTGEEVEIIDFEAKERGDRTDEDWVTYIDSNSKEHIKEHLNIQLDFKPIQFDVLSKMMEHTDWTKMPSSNNCRVFEVAKEFLLKGYTASEAVDVALSLVKQVDNLNI